MVVEHYTSIIHRWKDPAAMILGDRTAISRSVKYGT